MNVVVTGTEIRPEGDVLGAGDEEVECEEPAEC